MMIRPSKSSELSVLKSTNAPLARVISILPVLFNKTLLPVDDPALIFPEVVILVPVNAPVRVPPDKGRKDPAVESSTMLLLEFL